jgi:formamidase
MDVLVSPTTRDEDILGWDLRRPHPMSGPIAVAGAQAGDILRVEILDVETDTFGSTSVIPGFGLLTDDFPEPYLVTWGLHDGFATSGRMPGVRVPADPFVGVIGVAPSHERLAAFAAREAALAATGAVVAPPDPGFAIPAEEPYASTALRTIPPRETGGNLDVRDARAGAVLFLPVDVPGALLSLGDVHFAQGDGEVCGTAIETHGRVRLRLDVVPADRARWTPRTPTFESTEPTPASGRRYLVTTGLPLEADGTGRDMDLLLAARNAVRAMIDWLVAERGLSRQQAYVLCSVAVDLRIAEVVDVPNPVVTARCPLDLFHEVRPSRGAPS